MATVVEVEKARLCRGLIDVFTDATKVVESTLLPIDDTLPPRVHRARRQYAKVTAIGDLLDEIEWESTSTDGYELDVETHGWAAVTALERVVARAHFTAWELAENEDAEGSGEASYIRHSAEQELARIQQACREAKIEIEAPGIRTRWTGGKG